MRSFLIISILSCHSFFCFSQVDNLPVYKEKLKCGVYKNFEEFKNNNPSITEEFYTELKPRTTKNWKGTNSRTVRYRKSKRKIRKVWGYCDGHDIYVFHQVDFFKLEIDSALIGFFGYGHIDKSGAVAAGIVGGAVGGGIYSIAALAKAKNQKVYYVVNPISGSIMKKNNIREQNNDSVLGATKLIIYRRGKKELDEPFKFIVEDSIKGAFIPYSYIEVVLKRSRNPIRIYYGKSGECEFDLLLDAPTVYLECTLSRKDRKHFIEEVNSQTGEFYSELAKHFQDKRNRKKR